MSPTTIHYFQVKGDSFAFIYSIEGDSYLKLAKGNSKYMFHFLNSHPAEMLDDSVDIEKFIVDLRVKQKHIN